MLDGLDEVAPPYRAACVQAINRYRQDHGLVPLIVCSRETEYQTLAATLGVDTAISVQPLTAQQIDAYLASGVPALAAVQTALYKDPDLQDLLDTPLMLNVLALAYGEMPIGTDIPTTRQQIQTQLAATPEHLAAFARCRAATGYLAFALTRPLFP